MSVLTLLTDFGLGDYYVAAVKGTVLKLAPGTQIVDVSHDVPPGDVEAGAFLLAASVPWFPAGTVHFAVVDPGVGSERRILAARLSVPEDNWAVLPDNGLLTHLLDRGLVREVRAVERSDIFLQNPGQTFHGRDRFAPVAAYLLEKNAGDSLGPAIADPKRLPLEPPRRAPGRISGRVAHVDRYGNLVTDIPADWLPETEFRAEAGGRALRRRVTHYAEIPAGEPALLTGSLGTLEISLPGESLADRWQVGRGAGVEVTWRSEMQREEL